MKKINIKTLIIIILCIVLVISFWIITFKLNLENGWKFSPRSGLSFEELRNEIGKIWDKSPLSKAPDTKDNKQEKIDELTEKLAEELKKTELENWQTYTDTEVGFSLKYSPDIKFNIKKPPTELTLYITAEKIDSLQDEAPLGYGRLNALEDIQALEKGEYGVDVDFDSNKKVAKIDNKYAKDFVVFTRFEVCDVTFERKLVFYNNNYRVILTLRGPKNQIIESLPEYFKYDELNCGNSKIWDFDKQDDFYNDLIEKKSSTVAQNWFDTFDQILSTFEFLK